MKLSIIIPVFNSVRYLRRCLDSIKGQKLLDWECILIDDGSTDGGEVICDEYKANDPRFKVIHQKNAGVSVARNVGLDMAEGEWITFVDSDDWLDKEAFSDILDYASQKDADVILFGYTLSDGKTDYSTIVPPNGLVDLSKDLKSQWQGPWSKLFKKAVLTTVRFPIGIAIGEDMYFTFQVYLSTSKVYGLDRTYYHYFQNQESATHHISLEKVLQEKSIVEKMENMLQEKNCKEKWNLYINMRKMTVKNRFLVSVSEPRCDLWRKTFPEVNVFCYKVATPLRKIVYFLILLHFDIFIISLLKKHNGSK